MQWRWFIYLLVLLLMSGCGSKPPPPAPPPPPTRVVMELAAVADLNPNPLNQPSPLQLRIYELKTPGAFERAEFFTLYEQDKMALGADLLAQDQILIKPGETRRLERTLQTETGYIGFLAAYRDIDQAHWRAVVAVAPHKTTTIQVDLERLGLIAGTLGQ